jgi:hypothetical protein
MLLDKIINFTGNAPEIKRKKKEKKRKKRSLKQIHCIEHAYVSVFLRR